MIRTISERLIKQASNLMPAGVNSPVRAFGSVGGSPVFMSHANGAYVYDEDGNKYIDYINSWGPMILGHTHPKVAEAICKQSSKAFSFGAPTASESEIALLMTQMVPGLEMIRLVNSGTEACMSALRLARAYTNREKFIKFEGCYHGHADAFLVKAGSGLATFNINDSPGVTKGVVSDTLVARFNDIDSVEQLFIQFPESISAVIIEPVAGNMGCVPPANGFLFQLKKLCESYGALLIFDEVMTGFRLAKGGAQELYGIQADLVTFGKVLGGGMPMAAFGGKKEIMNHIAPAGKVYQAGTLSGNPISVAAGIQTLTLLHNDESIYKRLNLKAQLLQMELNQVFLSKGITHTINQVGSMISVFFGITSATNFNEVSQSDIPMFNKFFHHMLDNGVYLPPSAYETWFLSDSLTENDIDYTIHYARKFLK